MLARRILRYLDRAADVHRAGRGWSARDIGAGVGHVDDHRPYAARMIAAPLLQAVYDAFAAAHPPRHRPDCSCGASSSTACGLLSVPLREVAPAALAQWVTATTTTTAAAAGAPHSLRYLLPRLLEVLLDEPVRRAADLDIVGALSGLSRTDLLRWTPSQKKAVDAVITAALVHTVAQPSSSLFEEWLCATALGLRNASVRLAAAAAVPGVPAAMAVWMAAVSGGSDGPVTLSHPRWRDAPAEARIVVAWWQSPQVRHLLGLPVTDWNGDRLAQEPWLYTCRVGVDGHVHFSADFELGGGATSSVEDILDEHERGMVLDHTALEDLARSFDRHRDDVAQRHATRPALVWL